MKERSEDRQQGFSLPAPEGSERNPVWNILTRCTASIKACSLLPSAPVCCLLLLSSLQTSACVLSFFLLFISPPIALPPFLFLLLLCQMPFSLLRDETESVGLIIPNLSFASTPLPVQLSSSRSARPRESHHAVGDVHEFLFSYYLWSCSKPAFIYTRWFWRGSKVKATYTHFSFGMLACICKCFRVCVLSIYNIPMRLKAKMSIFSYVMPDLFFCVNCRWSRSTLRSLTWR